MQWQSLYKLTSVHTSPNYIINQQQEKKYSQECMLKAVNQCFPNQHNVSDKIIIAQVQVDVKQLPSKSAVVMEALMKGPIRVTGGQIFLVVCIPYNLYHCQIQTMDIFIMSLTLQIRTTGPARCDVKINLFREIFNSRAA